MVVTRVEVDTDLLRQAKEFYGVTSNSEAINFALHEVVTRQRQLDAIDVIAQLELDEWADIVPQGR